MSEEKLKEVIFFSQKRLRRGLIAILNYLEVGFREERDLQSSQRNSGRGNKQQ